MTGASPQQVQTKLSRQGWLVAALALVVVTLWYVFLATDGTLRFEVPECYRSLFPAMWRRLLEGRFDLDRSDLVGEAFLRDGKAYTYYGVFPAILRGLVSPVVPLDWIGSPGLSSVLAALVTCVSFVWAAVVLGVHRSRPALFAAYGVTVALATPVVSGLNRAHVFNEAGLWGAAWGSAFVAALVLFCATPTESPRRGRAMVLMAVFAGLALHSRLTVGACALLALGGVGAWSFVGPHRPPRKQLALAAGIACVACALQLGINQGRWGSPWTFRPLMLHESFANTERGQKVLHDGSHRLDRVTTGLRYYFLPGPKHLRPGWPYLRLGKEGSPEGPPPFDHIEFGMPLLWSSPALALFALLGLRRLRSQQVCERRGAVLLLGITVLLVGFFVTFDTLVIRYLMDFVPFLGGLGLLALLGEIQPRRPVLGSLLGLLVAFSVFGTYITTVLLKVYAPCAPAAAAHAESIRNMLGR